MTKPTSISLAATAETCGVFFGQIVGFVNLYDLANWRLHGVVDQSDVERAIVGAAAVVDTQSVGTVGYEPLADTPEKRAALLHNPAIVAALEIIDDALSLPSAYVEPALFRNRIAVKAGE